MDDVTHLVSGTRSPCGDRYRVAWAINPHMQPGRACSARAEAEHRGFVDALRDAGARVERLPFVRAAYDSVFVKDVVVMQRDARGLRGLVGRPRHTERRREIADRRRHLSERGVRIVACNAPLEGGDVVSTGRRLLLGHGFRSEPAAARCIARFAGMPVRPVRLTDPWLYHLDTALAYLDGGELLVAEGAIDPRDLAVLHDLPEVTCVIEVSREIALRFGLNLVQVGKNVVLGRGAETLAPLLRVRGYAPRFVPLSQFHLAGGSAACLTAPILTPLPGATNASPRRASTPVRAEPEPAEALVA